MWERVEKIIVIPALAGIQVFVAREGGGFVPEYTAFHPGYKPAL